MTRQFCITVPIACAALVTAGLLAQDIPQPVQAANISIAGLPPSRGIYYHAASEWVALSFNVLMPFAQGRSAVAEVLNVGPEHAVAEMPGAHAGVQIGNDPRPTFYLHGIPPAELKLVRAASKADYREIQMPINRNFWEWAHFRTQDVAEIDIQSLGGDVMTVTPRTGSSPANTPLPQGWNLAIAGC